MPAPWRLRKGWPTTWNNASVHEVLNIPCVARISDACLHPRYGARPLPGAHAVKCRFCAIKKTHINSPFWLLRRLKLQLLYPNLLALCFLIFTSTLFPFFFYIFETYFHLINKFLSTSLKSSNLLNGENTKMRMVLGFKELRAH